METNINIIAGRKESEAGIRFGTIATAPFWIDGKDESIDADGKKSDWGTRTGLILTS